MKAGKMSEGAIRPQLTRVTLARTRRRALRQRCWYRVLNRLERGVVDLTIRCVQEVRSNKLRNALTKILAKLIQALRPGYLNTVETVGRPIAARVSQLAQSWGNKEAVEWKDDPVLIRYLGFNKLRLRIFR